MFVNVDGDPIGEFAEVTKGDERDV